MTRYQSLLSRIVSNKRSELAHQQTEHSLDTIQARAATAPPVRDFAAALRRPGATALIAEIKKASPSRGVLLEDFDHRHLARTYMAHGAAALSILTDSAFFQGHLDYLYDIRTEQASGALPAHVPLLRKDFLIDPYQVYQARAYGADAVLLIVAALSDDVLQTLLDTTHALGMHALVEVHTEEELERALAVGARIVGVNNRDLHTFKTRLETTERLAALLPTGDARPLLVGESGIHTPADVERLRQCGVQAILVGEALVTAPDIAARVRELAGA
jgi:indole-3-glycerol phosphate synthase